MESLYQDLERRIVASPPGLCTIDLTRSFIKMCLAQSCGKCVPCRVGLRQLARLFDDVLDGNATDETLDVIRLTAEGIYLSADCAIGYEAAKLVLKCIDGCEDDFRSHIERGFCSCNSSQPVACVKSCPAGVDIPGYIALVHDKRYADAVRLIRRDNPLPVTCAYICEHPCENRCKRTLIDAPVNIRGLKKMAVDSAGVVDVPECGEPTGKKVAIIGGGPGGLSAAYYLSLMGHKVTIFEQRKQLGGMLRYGIPNYRLPRTKLDEDINAILSTGIEVKKNISVGTDITLEDINKEYDAIYLAIGANVPRKMMIEGEELEGVYGGNSLLENQNHPDYTNKKVAIIGGGNVAMDCARTIKRMGAEQVVVIYRRSEAEMPAESKEISDAKKEGVEFLFLNNIVKILGTNKVEKIECIKTELVQKEGETRKSPVNIENSNYILNMDYVVMAVGGEVDKDLIEKCNISTTTKKYVQVNENNQTSDEKVFAGGDVVGQNSTVAWAASDGKNVASKIIKFLEEK